MSTRTTQQIQSRTVKTLTLGQILGGFGLGSTLSIGALLAADLSGTAAWSGAAATFSTLGSAIWAIPLSRLAQRAGRKVALATGAALAIVGATLVITAATIRFFPLLLVALFLLGAGSAAGLQARFAATDLPSNKSAGRDLSVVVWATTLGAVIGPNLFGPGEIVGNWLGMPALTGPFLFTIFAQASATTVFWFGLNPDPLLEAQRIDAAAGNKNRPKLSFKAALETLRQYPVARYAMFSVALSHMVMVAVMSMTPVHMTSHGATLVLVGFTISLHIAGMYAFAPIFGWLSDKIGRVKTVVFGQIIFISALSFAGLGSENHTTVAIGLFLLGLGWSAATVAGSALLATSLPTDQKTNVQGVSDSLMSLAGAMGGAISGTVLAAFKFVGLNAAALIPVSAILILSAMRYLKAKSNQ